MADLALLGASGYTGRLVARALDARGLEFVAAGRRPDRVRDAVNDLDTLVDVREVNVRDDRALRRLCADTEVLITTVGPFVELGRPVLEAAVAEGCHYLDSTGEQPFIRWAFTSQGRSAAAAGSTAVPACGFDFVPGDLLAHLAADGLDDVREVHAAYLMRGPGLIWSRGTRASAVAAMDSPVAAFEDGGLVEEQVADTRRLCWFPQPVGPRHGASFPGGEAVTVPRHVAGLRTVRTYFAIPGALAETAKLGVSLMRWGPLRRLVTRAMTAGPSGPGEELRQATRWACVVEATAAADPSSRPGDRATSAPGVPVSDTRVSRAWAYGHDVYMTTARILAAAAERLAGTSAPPAGVVAPAEAFDPESFLDDLATASDLRWSTQLPEHRVVDDGDPEQYHHQ